MRKKTIQTFLGIVALFAIAYFQNYSVETENYDLKQIVNNKLSGEIITIEAKVIKLLADDNEGSKHQKFIVKNEDISLLVAHNIDLAPRVPISKGSMVKIRGEYEWNRQGGLIHWTHKDKRNKHPDGWIEYQKMKYH